MQSKSVALDGPSGAGKSTLAKMASRRFGLMFVDTGALYRCIGLFAYMNGVGSKDEAGVTALLPLIDLEMKHGADGAQRMLLGGADVTDDIRMPEISVYASDVSAMPPVRAYLLSLQRGMAEKYDVVMDGRDIGTVIMPDAGLKVFLTANLDTRAQRRYLELAGKGVDTTFDEVLADMSSRDKNDSERAAAPLKAAVDAVWLDTTDMDLNESFDALCGLIRARFSL